MKRFLLVAFIMFGSTIVLGQFKSQPRPRRVTEMPPTPCNPRDFIQVESTSISYICRADSSGWDPSGNVIGPASSLDNALPRFNGSTGRSFQGSGVVVDDNDNLTVPGVFSTGGSVVGEVRLTELVANGTNFRSWRAPNSLTTSVTFALADTSPADSLMLFATPADGVSSVSFAGTTGSGSFARIAGSLNVTSGKTVDFSNTLTFTGTDSSSVAFGAGGTVTYTVASGTSVLGTSAIASGACATVVTTTATGTATTDTIGWGFNGNPTGITGYAPSADGMLTIIAYPSSNNVNFLVCNNLASSVTPGAITLNWRVIR